MSPLRTIVRQWTTLVLLAAVTATGCAADGSGGSRRSPALTEKRATVLRNVLEQFYAESRFPGAVLGAWMDCHEPMVVAVGVADRERGVPMAPEARMHAGSAGKMFFAALILQLAGQGRLGLDDRASRFLATKPWYTSVPNSESVTIRMLLNHTSGIPEYGHEFMESLISAPDRVRAPLDAVQSVATAAPAFPAGTAFRYSDVNYQLLQFIAEQVTGRSAFDEIQRRFLDPYQLTSIVPADRQPIPGLVPGYAGGNSSWGFDSVLLHGRLLLDPAFEGGAGGYVTNARDLAHWAALFAGGHVFPAHLLPEVRRGVPAGDIDVGNEAVSGLGLAFVETSLGPAYGHGGFFPGYVSLTLWYPDVGVALAIQVNSSASDALSRPLSDVLNEAARALADLRRREHHAIGGNQ